jgi:hypothetical protein
MRRHKQQNFSIGVPHALLVLVLLCHVEMVFASTVQVTVVDEFIEMHTGPGRGFPIVNVAEKGQQLQVLKSKTNWYKVKTHRNKLGWVDASALSRTRIGSKPKVTFARIDTKRVQEKKFRAKVGAGWLETDASFSAGIGYALLKSFSVDLEFIKASGDFSSTSAVSVLGNLELFPRKKISPYVYVGSGQIVNVPRATLVGREITNSPLVSLGAGVSYRLSRTFYFDTALSSISFSSFDDQSKQYLSWQTGVAVRF